MAPKIEDLVLDGGLTILDTVPTTINICSGEPTTYALATTTSFLGAKTFAAGSVFGAPAAGAPNGRKVSSVTVTDGSISTAGTAAWWAITNTGTLFAHGSLQATQVVSAGNSFTLAVFDIRIPGESA